MKKPDFSQVRRRVKVRPYDAETDRNFILGTFLKSVYMGSDCYEGVSEQEYNDKTLPIIRDKVDNQKCLVACNVDDPNQIYGYIIYSPENVVYLLYVKKHFRKLKIASLLFCEAFGEHDTYQISYPFKTYMTERLKEKYKHTLKMKHNILLW